MTKDKVMLGDYEHSKTLTPNGVFGDWVVTKQGDLDYNNGRYFISCERLKEKDWLSHMQEKGWIDLNDFIPAFWYACKINNIVNLTIKIY
jgi:hypothetical protein